LGPVSNRRLRQALLPKTFTEAVLWARLRKVSTLFDAPASNPQAVRDRTMASRALRASSGASSICMPRCPPFRNMVDSLKAASSMATETRFFCEKEMLASPDQQISLTGPDSRSMATSGRGSGVVGYNVQVAVDTQEIMQLLLAFKSEPNHQIRPGGAFVRHRFGRPAISIGHRQLRRSRREHLIRPCVGQAWSHGWCAWRGLQSSSA
jgi:hypothetical protein